MTRLLSLAALALAAGPSFAEDKAAPPVKVVGKLAAAAPGEWKAEKPANTLRSHQFKLPGADGAGDAEVIVMPDSSPDADKFFPRWKATFVPADGKAADVATESKFEAGGATFRVLDLTGTWKYKPFPQAKTEELRENSRAVWVIAAKGDDATHVRLSGPAATVEKYRPGFEAWLKGIK